MIKTKEQFIIQHKPTRLFVYDEFNREALEDPMMGSIDQSFRFNSLEEIQEGIELCSDFPIYDEQGNELNNLKDDFKAIIVKITEEISI